MQNITPYKWLMLISGLKEHIPLEAVVNMINMKHKLHKDTTYITFIS